MEYTAIEREDPAFIAYTQELVRMAKELIALDALDAGQNASLECILDELEARGYDTDRLYVKERP